MLPGVPKKASVRTGSEIKVVKPRASTLLPVTQKNIFVICSWSDLVLLTNMSKNKLVTDSILKYSFDTFFCYVKCSRTLFNASANSHLLLKCTELDTCQQYYFV